MKLATAEQMREIDRKAISEFGIASIDLMESAAGCVVEEIIRRFSEKKTFAAICGPGNNGGDGLVIARKLVQDHGWNGSIWLVQTPESKCTQDHDTNLKRAQELGLTIGKADAPEFDHALKTADIVIDAILGTASSGAPRPYVADAISRINYHAMGSVIAVDIPTGVNCDTGEVAGIAVRAALTVTLGFSKPGLHLSLGCEYVGELVVRDSFLPGPLITAHNASAQFSVPDPSDIKAWLPSRNPTRDANKGKYGSVMILAGSQGFAGAACLSALGAARTGAGTVTLGVPEGLIDVVMARAPEVVMTRGFADNGARQFKQAAVQDVINTASKMSAIGLGPGIGHESDEIRGFVLDLIRSSEKPMVLDADALTIIATLGDEGVAAIKKRKLATILTPHPGEMARLLGCKSSDVQNDRLGSVKKAAEKYGCVVLLKGDRTLIAAPDGRVAINQSGNPGMASGGMGDVLTGIATTCLGQIDNPFEAAATAAYLHGLAGDIARDEIGIAGLLATDIAEKIPQAITRCLRD